MGRLQGKTALVTAAGQGIGRATVEAFVREGARVIATDLRAESLEGLDGAIAKVVDVTDAAAVAAVAAEHPDLDILYNCAGYVHAGTILDCDEEAWAFSNAHAGTILDCDEEAWAFSNALNVTAQFRMIRAVLPSMIGRGGGSIINMSSICSSIKAVPNRFAYGATKAAVIGLTKSVAVDYVGQGIRCNAICPGTVETPSLLQRLRDTGDFDKAYAEFTARQAMGRFGRVEEIAALAVYLASDESAFTTGTVNVIDGGWVN